MLPRWHVIYGLAFSLIIYFIFDITIIQALLIFLSSFLIDIDHYFTAVRETGKWSLSNAIKFHETNGAKQAKIFRSGKEVKEPFHVLHTLEINLLILILSIIYNPAFFIFLGMIFHIALDVIYLRNENVLGMREFFLSKWIRRNL